MNKIKGLFLAFLLAFLCGCGSKENVINDFTKKVDNAKSYTLNGEMTLVSGEDSYNYDVEVNYKYDDYYKVTLVNQSNEHKQVILKNNEGTYVVTPALNKSFSFQSKWPDNSSQSYLLKSLVKDIKDTKKPEITKDKEYKVVIVDVNYPNNNSLKKEKIYFDKNNELKKVEVLNNEGNTIIKMQFNKIKYSKRFDSNNFKLESLVDTNIKENEEKQESVESKESTNESTESQTNESNSNEEKTTETSILENVVYPLYLPKDTHLQTKDTVETDNGDRIIMTYTGSKPFMIIEELSKASKEMEVTSIYGEPLILSSAIGALSENSLEWQTDTINYYISSSYLSSEEMMTIAESLNTASVVEITNNK